MNGIWITLNEFVKFYSFKIIYLKGPTKRFQQWSCSQKSWFGKYATQTCNYLICHRVYGAIILSHSWIFFCCKYVVACSTSTAIQQQASRSTFYSAIYEIYFAGFFFIWKKRAWNCTNVFTRNCIYVIQFYGVFDVICCLWMKIENTKTAAWLNSILDRRKLEWTFKVFNCVVY